MRNFILTLISSIFLMSPTFAGNLSAPSGKVLLTVSGLIEHTNVDGSAQFDRQMLEALDWQKIRTFTSFSDGEQVFEGPTLAAVLKAVGASGDMLDATAINDYSTEIPVSDAKSHNVFLAMVWNGKTMRVRNKGPIWVVYPTTEDHAKTQPYDRQMIWQLDRIVVR